MKQTYFRGNALTRALGIGLILAIAPLAAHAGTLTVSAASSLTNVFKEVATAFNKVHPEIAIQYNFAASGALLQQIRQGAPVDVFASADQKSMNDAAQAGMLDEATRKNFVRNEVVLIVPSSSDDQVRDLHSLESSAVTKIAVGSVASVPVGRYTREGLEKSGLWQRLTPKFIFAENVRQVLDYVSRGEVQAGFVYATDAAVRSDKVRVVQPLPIDTVVSYPVAVVKSSANVAEARSFVEFLGSDQAQAIFSAAGFRKP
ncbi:MAG TPA: molybdate ABC transporter substrate-binding protein [Advenella sp.]|nr:molybdate ABC transporter substrate-binding protein [Advenella sp.]